MKNPYYNGPKSDHFDGVRFYNADVPASDQTLWDVLKWKLFTRTKAKSSSELSWERNLKPAPSFSGLKITHIGHASYLIQTSNKNILVDPVWSERASPFSWIGPKRHNPPSVAFEDLPEIHAVLVTHNHYDHLDGKTLATLWRKFRPTIISPLGNDAIMRRFAPDIQVLVGDWGSEFSLSDDIVVSIVPAYHWSARGINDRRMALWGGFVIRTPAGVIYCAGDTAYRQGQIFKLILKKFGRPRVALLPIGAYAPRWFMKTQHATPAEAVQIALDCEAQQFLGIHWGTFDLSDEALAEPKTTLQRTLLEKALSEAAFRAFAAGDIWTAEERLSPSQSETAKA